VKLEPERQAALREHLTRMMGRNGYNPVTRGLTIEPVRARAFEAEWTTCYQTGLLALRPARPIP
jgi:hypothetical protein